MPVFSVPVPAIAFAWWRLRVSPCARTIRNIIPLVIATVSQVWILSVFLTQSVLGPGYSNVRSGIILVNLLSTFGAGVFSLVSGVIWAPRTLRIITGAACLLLAVEWLIIAAANSVA